MNVNQLAPSDPASLERLAGMAHLNGIRCESRPSRPRTARASAPNSLLSLPEDHGLAYEAVLFDALGTLVELEPPWPLLRESPASRHGIDVPEDDAKRAMLAEMRYYRAHHHEGSDEPSLRDLRKRADALREHLPRWPRPDDDLVEALLASLRFRLYGDAAPVLGRLRLLTGLQVVSNWDVSLRDVLADLGSRRAPRPHRRLGRGRSAQARSRHRRCAAPPPMRPARALMVGDSPETDIAAAQAAGVRGVIIDRVRLPI